MKVKSNIAVTSSETKIILVRISKSYTLSSNKLVPGRKSEFNNLIFFNNSFFIKS